MSKVDYIIGFGAVSFLCLVVAIIMILKQGGII